MNILILTILLTILVLFVAAISISYAKSEEAEIINENKHYFFYYNFFINSLIIN